MKIKGGPPRRDKPYSFYTPGKKLTVRTRHKKSRVPKRKGEGSSSKHQFSGAFAVRSKGPGYFFTDFC